MCTDLLAKAMVGYEGIWFKSLRFILNLNQILKIPISITLVQTPFMLPDKKTDINLHLSAAILELQSGEHDWAKDHGGVAQGLSWVMSDDHCPAIPLLRRLHR